MPMTLNCPKCKKPFRVRDDSAGMRVKCPTCGAVLQVPATLSPPSADGSRAPGDSTTAAHTSESDSKSGKADGGDDQLRFDQLPPTSYGAGPPSLASKTSAEPKKQQNDEADETIPGKEEERVEAFKMAPATRKPAAVKASNKPKKRAEPDADPGADAEGWRKVRGGLRFIQFGLLLAVLPAIGNFAVTAVCQTNDVRIPDNFASENVYPKFSDADVVAASKKSPLHLFNLMRDSQTPPDKSSQAGLLGKPELSLWKELEIVYAVGIPLLAFLLVLFGLLKCRKVPDSAKTRGVATGAFLLTFLSLLGLGGYAAAILLPAFGVNDLLPTVKKETMTFDRGRPNLPKIDLKNPPEKNAPAIGKQEPKKGPGGPGKGGPGKGPGGMAKGGVPKGPADLAGKEAPEQMNAGTPSPPEEAKDKPQDVQKMVREISLTVFVSMGTLAILWLCIFMCQAGVALHSTRVLRDMAVMGLLVVLVIAGVPIANEFFPVSLSSPKFNWEELTKTYLIQAGVYVVFAVIVYSRVASIAGQVRRSITKWTEENAV